MAEQCVKFILQLVVEVRTDFFGENSRFIRFERDDETRYDCSRGKNSTAIFGTIRYERDGRRHYSDPLVLKISPRYENLHKYNAMAYFNEVFFYTRVLPLYESARPLGHLFPKYYDSMMRCSATTDTAIIVFQNVQADGYVQARTTPFLDYDHLVLIMRKLGEFHAYSYHLKKEANNLFQLLASSLSETSDSLLKCLPEWLKTEVSRESIPLPGDVHYRSKMVAAARSIDQANESFCDFLHRDMPASVLCHGDMTADNVLFKYDDHEKPCDLKFVDLASCRFASPAVDLMSILYLNANQSLRDAHWNDLLDEYYSSLENTFSSGKIPSKADIQAEFKSKAALGYFIASTFLPYFIAKDRKLPDFDALLPDQSKSESSFVYLEARLNILTTKGGKQCTKALSDILKDMIDRGFF